MSFFISACLDMDALRASGLVDEDSPYRGVIDGRSGAHIQYSPDGTKSMIILTSIDGLEALAHLNYIKVAPVEQWIETERQVVIDGEPQWTTETVEKPGYFKDAPTGEFVNGDPIYKVNRVVTETTRTVMDEDGNTFEVPGRPVVEYVTTDEIEGYQQIPVTEQVWVDAESCSRTVPVIEVVQPDPELKSIYDEIYPRTPWIDEAGNTRTPPGLFAAPGGVDVWMA